MNDSNQRGTLLEVPYKEKDQAKALGARWDPDLKKWFVPSGQNLEPFRKWFPQGEKERTGSGRDAAGQ